MVKILKFSIVGALNTVINYIVYCLLCYVSVNYLVALVVAYLVAMLNSFVLNKIWTFEDREKSDVAQISKFVCINVASCLLNAFFLWGLVESGLNLYIAQLVATVILLVFNFIFYKSFVFKKKSLNDLT